jgi:thiol:disulfide interchange protein DsbD
MIKAQYAMPSSLRKSVNDLLGAAANLLVQLSVVILFLSPSVVKAEDFLAPEEAFKFSAYMVDASTAEVNFAIADGYYMYREQFKFAASGANLGQPEIPNGKVKFDETFQKDVETYRNTVAIRLPVDAAGPFQLTVTSQGCTDRRLCYPPMESRVNLTTPVVGSVSVDGAAAGSSISSVATDVGRIEASLHGGKLLTILPLFVLLGLGLSFTPCVLPMVPILSSIIVGDRQKITRGRGVVLSAVYSLGMAIAYTLLGVAAGLAGEGLAATLQNPWVLGAFALLMVGLSLSMFGMYQLQVPAAIQSRLMQASDRQAGGRLAGVLVMGALSALIVGPCVAAPLAGVLLYISQTRDVLIGGSALFAMAAGMSIPLLLAGASAGSLLPRAGAWMEDVKHFFGVLLLATALWTVSPVLSAEALMLGWAGLGIGYAVWLLLKRQGWGSLVLAMMVGFLGALQLVGVVTGGRHTLTPLAQLSGTPVQATDFTRVRSVQELDRQLAANKDKVVMLDFYAEWCVSCIEMEGFTFSDPRVKEQFADMVLLQADVTKNNADDKALLKRFSLFGPPGIIFFDTAGREIAEARVIGYQNTDEFLSSLSRASGPASSAEARVHSPTI